MEGNKDDAMRCVEIGRAALDSGDRNRALKFLSKARRLDPSLPLDDLISQATSDSAQPMEPKPSHSGPRRRVPPSGSSPASQPAASSSSSAPAPPTYTEEQVTIVREIKRKKDYYEILGLEKSCSVEDVRKAYRKLSLKVHPDKNQAPGAEEAFKLVSKAFQCLSDEENRRRYDVAGSDEPVYERHVNRRHGQGFNGFYGEEIDPEEIFRNFFYGGMNPGVATRFGSFSFGPGVGVRVGGNNAPNGIGRTLLQLLPILLILLLNFLPSNDPVYMLSRQYPYEHRFTTGKDVNFYMKSPRYELEYPPNSVERAKLEQQVERDYVSILSHNCRMERQRMHWGYVRETPYCDTLEKFLAMA